MTQIPCAVGFGIHFEHSTVLPSKGGYGASSFFLVNLGSAAAAGTNHIMVLSSLVFGFRAYHWVHLCQARPSDLFRVLGQYFDLFL